jgi:hypothetical protein
MTGPVYALEAWIARVTGTRSEAAVLGLIFVAALGIVPLASCGAAAWLTLRLTSARAVGVVATGVRYAYALVPLGVAMWLAHDGFHFLTGAGTIVPVAQSAVAETFGRALLGAPDWWWSGLAPGKVFPLQAGAILLGALGSLVFAHRVSEREFPERAAAAVAPWSLLVVGLALAALWVLSLPMEMRGTSLGG